MSEIMLEALKELNKQDRIKEALDKEVEYAIYMFDGESGPSENDSDPITTFVASNEDEAEEKFQDFVSKNSTPRSHIVYRYRKLHQTVGGTSIRTSIQNLNKEKNIKWLSYPY